MSKKNRAVLESERQHFIEGAKQNGYHEDISKQIFDLILKFADYGFPNTHAVSYSKNGIHYELFKSPLSKLFLRKYFRMLLEVRRKLLK
ncbi:hypothetical protein ACVPOR_07690 [Staphylococcus aureus]